ncbi:MAG TPA: HlyD family efflux transporter periplasmic adaptor subunit [Methylomirabilota bacterium]|nr:HlyD family efflux transporter periplasmic adaptor subunit [Methylomirabilota bacterium]
MSVSNSIELTIEAGGRRGTIVGFEYGAVFLNCDLGLSNAPIEGTVRMTDGPLGADMAVTLVRAAETCERRGAYGYRIVAPAQALATVARMGRETGKDRFRHVLAMPRPVRRVRTATIATSRTRRTGGFVAATLVLGVVVSMQLHQRLFTFAADTARIVVDGRALLAEKAGRIVFVTDRAEVQAGEPVVGVRTGSGYEQPFTAPVAGRVAEVLVRPGDRVALGEPVMVVNPAGALVYVLARIRTADAVRLAYGYEAEITFADGSRARAPVGPADIVPLRGVGGTARVDVRIEVAEDLAARLGEPATVRFSSSPRMLVAGVAPTAGGGVR